MQDQRERTDGTTQVQYRHKVAIRATLATMTAEQRAAKLAQLHRAAIQAQDETQRANLRAIASEVSRINSELAPTERRQYNVAPVVTAELVRGVVGVGVVGGAAYGAFHMIAFAVGSGILPWIGGGALLLFMISSLNSGGSESRPVDRPTKRKITVTQTTIIEE